MSDENRTKPRASVRMLMLYLQFQLLVVEIILALTMIEFRAHWRTESEFREEQTRRIIQKFEEVAQVIGPYPAEELAKKIREEQLRSEQ